MSNYGHTRWIDPDQKVRIAPPKGRFRAIWDLQIADGKAREIIERRAAKQPVIAAEQSAATAI